MLHTSDDISTALKKTEERRRNRPDEYRTVALTIGGILLASIVLAVISASTGSDSAGNSFYYALFWTVPGTCLITNTITLVRAQRSKKDMARVRLAVGRMTLSLFLASLIPFLPSLLFIAMLASPAGLVVFPGIIVLIISTIVAIANMECWNSAAERRYKVSLAVLLLAMIPVFLSGWVTFLYMRNAMISQYGLLAWLYMPYAGWSSLFALTFLLLFIEAVRNTKDAAQREAKHSRESNEPNELTANALPGEPENKSL